MIPRYFARCSGDTYVMFWPLSRTTPRSGTASPLITRSTVDFPAPFVPSSASVSPFLHLEVDAEEHLHRAVREVDVRELQQRDRLSCATKRFSVLLLLLEQLLDDERQVVADVARAVHQQRAADDRARHAEDDHGAAHADRVGEEARDEAAHEAADEEDVERRHRGAHPAEAVRHDGLQHRADHRERRRGEHRLRDLQDPEPGGAVHAELQRREQRRRQDERADERERLGRVLAVHPVEVATDERQDRQREDARQAQDDPALQQVVDVQRVVEVERLERGVAEQSEPERAERRRARCGSCGSA